MVAARERVEPRVSLFPSGSLPGAFGGFDERLYGTLQIGRTDLELIVITLQPMAQTPLGIVNHDGPGMLSRSRLSRARVMSWASR